MKPRLTRAVPKSKIVEGSETAIYWLLTILPSTEFTRSPAARLNTGTSVAKLSVSKKFVNEPLTSRNDPVSMVPAVWFVAENATETVTGLPAVTVKVPVVKSLLLANFKGLPETGVRKFASKPELATAVVEAESVAVTDSLEDPEAEKKFAPCVMSTAIMIVLEAVIVVFVLLRASTVSCGDMNPFKWRFSDVVIEPPPLVPKMTSSSVKFAAAVAVGTESEVGEVGGTLQQV